MWVIGVWFPVADVLVICLKPDPCTEDFDELVVEVEDIVGEISQYLTDVSSEFICVAVVVLLIFVAFEKPRGVSHS